MLIRAATVADIPVMMALAREAPSAAHWSYPQYEIAVGSVDRVASVIEEDSVIAAFVVARVLDREWEIENLIVAGECRRRGLGARLLNEMMKLARLQKAQSHVSGGTRVKPGSPIPL